MPSDLWFGRNNNDLPQLLADVCFAEVRAWQAEQHCCAPLRDLLPFLLERGCKKRYRPNRTVSRRSDMEEEKCHIQGRCTQLRLACRGAQFMVEDHVAHMFSDVAKHFRVLGSR